MNDLIDLRGKTAVVTGGSRGVGRATALLLARAGASVGIAYRSRQAEADAVVAQLEGLGVRAWAQRGDLTDAADADALFGRAREEFDGLDIFIGAYNLLDIVPKGRDEGSLTYGMEWVRHHDRYDDASFVDPYVDKLRGEKEAQ